MSKEKPTKYERQLLAEIDDLRFELSIADPVIDVPAVPVDLSAALAALHEQAHGREPVRMCQQEPCRSIQPNWRGPAPLTLGGVA